MSQNLFCSLTCGNRDAILLHGISKSFPVPKQGRTVRKEEERTYEQAHEDLRRQRSGGICRLCVFRGSRHLPHYAVQSYGRARRCVVCQGEEEHLRPAGTTGGDAVRGRRRRAGHQLHRLAGPYADDPHHAPYLRRAAARRTACGVPYRGHPRILHLRRPLRRDELPPDGLCHAVQRQRAAGRRPGCRGAPQRHQGPHPVPAFL